MTKLSDGEAPVLDLRRMSITLSSPLLSGLLWPGVEVPVRVPSMGQIEIFNFFYYTWNHLTVCKQTSSVSFKNVSEKLFVYKSYIFNVCALFRSLLPRGRLRNGTYALLMTLIRFFGKEKDLVENFYSVKIIPLCSDNGKSSICLSAHFLVSINYLSNFFLLYTYIYMFKHDLAFNNPQRLLCN